MNLVSLGREHFADVVETLCDAFHDYPVMRYVLKDAGERYDARLAELIGYFTDSRVSRGWPVLGVAEAGRLLAAANINPPRSEPAPPALERRYERLCRSLGQAAMARFDAFAEAGAPYVPDEPHYYLGMIGVRTGHQGRGLSRVLLDALHARSAEDEDSTGVVLTTELPRNLPLYEHFGYHVVGHARVEELETWTMYRPDP